MKNRPWGRPHGDPKISAAKQDFFSIHALSGSVKFGGGRINFGILKNHANLFFGFSENTPQNILDLHMKNFQFFFFRVRTQ